VDPDPPRPPEAVTVTKQTFAGTVNVEVTPGVLNETDTGAASAGPEKAASSAAESADAVATTSARRGPRRVMEPIGRRRIGDLRLTRNSRTLATEPARVRLFGGVAAILLGTGTGDGSSARQGW